jgi:hypothetical protein
MSDEKMVDAPKRSKCDNCGKIFADGEMKEIEHLSERVAAGGKMPSGECGECGSLCFQMALDMPEKNIERAGWAEKGLLAYGHENGVRFEQEPVSTVGDFLADLMHLCDRDGLNFEAMLEHGREHYDHESICHECDLNLKAGDDSDNAEPLCARCVLEMDKEFDGTETKAPKVD